jgi:two-component system alkaline phosphatase synthesis response regulator PhoP
VEDDDNIRELVIYALTRAGFEAQGLTDGEALFEALRKHIPELILLDLMLPGEDGIAILKKLKTYNHTKKARVIILTAKDSELDCIRGLDTGADDYITKPFSVMELISRVRAVLRRDPDNSLHEITAGSITLSPEKRRAWADGEEVVLTYKEFELLLFLMTNAGIVLSRDKILGQVWGYDYIVESRTVDMHVKSLRQKLGKSGSLIKTVRNVGYKIEEKP